MFVCCIGTSLWIKWFANVRQLFAVELNFNFQTQYIPAVDIFMLILFDVFVLIKLLLLSNSESCVSAWKMEIREPGLYLGEGERERLMMGHSLVSTVQERCTATQDLVSFLLYLFDEAWHKHRKHSPHQRCVKQTAFNSPARKSFLFFSLFK